MIVEGRAWVLGDNVDTDQIVAGRYLSLTDPEELAKHCLEGPLPDFHRSVEPGDILVAGDNLGCGSSREHAVIALKAAGISCLVARSFARIFFRNAINLGLPALISPEAVEGVAPGDRIRIDLDAGELVDLTNSFRCSVAPLPDSLQEIIGVDGLMGYVRQRLALDAPQTS